MPWARERNVLSSLSLLGGSCGDGGQDGGYGGHSGDGGSYSAGNSR